jgi:hypothetical protein
MRELIHQHLFIPPPGVKVVVIPVCGESWPKPPAAMKTPMETGYAYVARTKWKNIEINVGILQWKMGVTPHPLTAGDDKGRIFFPGKQKSLPLKYHLVTLPTRKFREEAITIDFLCQKLRELAALVNDRIPWLKEGDVALPQICDKDKPWSYWKPYAELYLRDNRFIVISGKEGTVT